MSRLSKLLSLPANFRRDFAIAKEFGYQVGLSLGQELSKIDIETETGPRRAMALVLFGQGHLAMELAELYTGTLIDSGIPTRLAVLVWTPSMLTGALMMQVADSVHPKLPAEPVAGEGATLH